jgi:hypothetical protein
MATWKTVTVNPVGGDYASLNAALAGEATDLTAQTGDLVISCENFEDTTTVSTSGQTWTTDATHRVIIEAADSHGGKWSTSAYRHVQTTGVSSFAESGGIEDLILRGIQFYANHGANGASIFVQQDNQTRGTLEFEKCIFILDHVDVEAVLPGILKVRDSQTTMKLRNCLFYGMGNATSATAIESEQNTGTCYIDNCTIDDFYYAFLPDFTSNFIVRNTRVTGATAVMHPDSTNLNSASDYNLTDIAAPTNWGTNSIDSTDTPTIDYVDSTNATLTSRDYHLGLNDSGIDQGQDLSSDANNPFTDDIDGETRG